MNTIVQTDSLAKRFGDFVAVDNINLSVKQGEIFGFLGPNGAGKSTTIKMLCGILTPTSGSGSVAGFDIVTEQEQIKRVIGYMSQRFSLYEDLTVSENLELFSSIYGLEGKERRRAIDDAIRSSNLTERADEMTRDLPAGLKQRLALGSAIIHDPRILFLDEPTSGVDPIMRKNFWDMIYGFSQEGKTIFVTTHYMDEAEHCSRIALIIAGRIMALGTPEHLKSSLPYTIYSLTVENFIEVFHMLKRDDIFPEIAIFGSDLHLMTESGKDMQKGIRATLKKRGIKKFDLNIVAPTLEDVFVYYSKKSGDGAT